MKRFVVLAFAVLVLCGSTLWAQDRCLPFTGTIYAGLVYDIANARTIWLGSASYNIDNREAVTVTENTGLKKGNPADPESKPPLIGTELTTVDFGSGDKFQLITRFVGTKIGVNETGTIAGFSGIYEAVYGHFTAHGPAGPTVAPPPTPPGYVSLGWGWMSEYHGNICGIN